MVWADPTVSIRGLGKHHIQEKATKGRTQKATREEQLGEHLEEQLERQTQETNSRNKLKEQAPPISCHCNAARSPLTPICPPLCLPGSGLRRMLRPALAPLPRPSSLHLKLQPQAHHRDRQQQQHQGTAMHHKRVARGWGRVRRLRGRTGSRGRIGAPPSSGTGGSCLTRGGRRNPTQAHRLPMRSTCRCPFLSCFQAFLSCFQAFLSMAPMPTRSQMKACDWEPYRQCIVQCIVWLCSTAQ